ncbi:hypothetical protein CARUB_v10007921mg, partial [Capsella rubella]
MTTQRLVRVEKEWKRHHEKKGRVNQTANKTAMEFKRHRENKGRVNQTANQTAMEFKRHCEPNLRVIPDPLSDDEEDHEDIENEDGYVAPRDVEDPEGLLALEKTFKSSEDFKLAVLRYSLKTRYGIKLYRSQALKVGAKCCYVDEDGIKCPWRVSCSYERRKHKMQIKVYINEHRCVRSRYTKMLKRSSIAYLFEERLRLNRKITMNEMVAEIKREYNFEVTPDQCAKAKTK